MPKDYRVIVQCKQANGLYDKGTVIHTGEFTPPETILDLGLRHEEQITVLRRLQDAILEEQSVDLQEAIQFCPKCGYELNRNGITRSTFNAVLTDHKVAVHRLTCMHCHWHSVASIKSLFGTQLHPDLVKLQCEQGSKASYSVANETLNKLSSAKRCVNNVASLKHVNEMVGNYSSHHPNTTIPKQTKPATELLVQVDGGHVKSKNKEERSFEALTAVVYRPEAVVPGKKQRDTGYITRKHCAASALSDQGAQINKLTLLAAQKEGLTQETAITALCDGAENCWHIIDSLRPHCQKIERILDWFHIAKKFQNTRMGDTNNFALARAKWFLWHNKVDKCLDRLRQIKGKLTSQKQLNKIDALMTYLESNREKLVHYAQRYKEGKTISSQMAESTVESLINQRCKGKRHMQWTREGLHPILQLRALVFSHDWDDQWEQIVMGAYTKAA